MDDCHSSSALPVDCKRKLAGMSAIANAVNIYAVALDIICQGCADRLFLRREAEEKETVARPSPTPWAFIAREKIDVRRTDFSHERPHHSFCHSSQV